MAGLAVALLAEISINPFGSAFRFSLGPVGLAILSLFFVLPAYGIGAAAGVVVPLVHAVFAFADNPALSPHGVLAAIGSYLPETLAYSLLGLLLSLFRVRDRTHTPLRLAGLLACADFLTNAVELLIRHEGERFQAALPLLLVAVGRAAVAAGAFYILQAGVRERQWAEERRSYMQRLFLVANLQTETYFLNKSTREIEQVMAKAHRLYRELADHPEQPLALAIAKDIHEVKKDCQRTMAALNRLVEAPKLEPEMNLAEVVALVFEANRTYAQTLDKQILFHFDRGVDFRTARFGRWVTVLNNLVSNAVEACRMEGQIALRVEQVGDRLQLDVIDTGSGIDPADQAFIFSPGFSTKTNLVTGAFSSGIGLTHVAGLIEAMHGTIRILRSSPSGTAFRLEVPWEALEVITPSTPEE